MASVLDRRIDERMARVTAAGSPLAVAGDRDGALIAATAPATLAAFFDHFCAQHGGTTAIVAGAERVSFAALHAGVDALARALVARGIGKGDRIAIAMRNCPAWIAAFFAIAKAGGIATLVNGWWQPDELAYGLALARPRLVLADAERARRITAAGVPCEVVTLPIEAPLADALAPLLREPAPNIALPVVAPEDDATILFTSGSTGRAKGAVSTHRAVTTGVYAYLALTLAAHELMIEDGGPPAWPPVVLVAVPLFHVTGMVPVLLNSVAIGRTLVMMPRWDAGDALRLIERERVTYFVGVPTMSLELMQHPDRACFDTHSLADIAAGGAARPVAHVARLKAAFPDGHPMLGYGLTETNAVGCTNLRQNYLDKPASTGRAQRPFVDVAILDEAARAVPPGKTGEIAIRSAALFRGYWDDPAATAAAMARTDAGACFRTGDIGYLDADGYLFIVDRVKDIIIRGGENISCIEVEAAIYAQPAIAEACVFGLPDERLGEVPAAVVHPKSGAALDVAALTTFLAARLAQYKVPRRLWVSDTPLPKLGTGKIDKGRLRATYRALTAEEALPA